LVVVTPPVTGCNRRIRWKTWTAGGNVVNTARQVLAGAGTQTAGLAFGGFIATP
jgi:hypothetical protein